MNSIFAQKLALENYRNFQNFETQTNNTPIILLGENGSGKTNILEAISLFFPGRGIRSAKLTDICKHNADHCRAHILLQSKIGPAEISTCFMHNANKRITTFNGHKIQNNELNRFVNMLWITPQMEGIFTTSASERRKFLDRIVYNFINSHATSISQYEHYMHERSKAIEQYYVDGDWIARIEDKMTDLAINIANNRIEVLGFIQTAINELENDFPKAVLSIDGIIEQKICAGEQNIKEFIRNQLHSMRERDKPSKRTNFGTHKSDFTVFHKDKNTPAKLCSTGEQKAMLITIILAQVNHMVKFNSIRPILLLDEVFVHLDHKKREYLTDFFLTLKLQLWVTTTDLAGIDKLATHSQIITL